MKLDSQSLAGKKYPGLMRLSMPIATTALGKLPKMLVQEFFGSYPPLSRVDVLMQESFGSQSMATILTTWGTDKVFADWYSDFKPSSHLIGL